MDDRQTKIREGAGLEDSRVNQEFVDFLNKWSSPVLLTLAVGALVWAGLQWLERKKNTRIDQAFGELEAATTGTTPSPTSLIAIAGVYEGVRSVPELAKLTAVDIYLRAFTVGVQPGAQIDQFTRTISNPDDILDEAELERNLSLAESTAREVLESSRGNAGKVLFEMQALSRLAAIEECKDDFDAAKGYYEQLKSLSEREQYPSIVSFTEARIANLETLKSVDLLPTREMVPLLPGETPPMTREQIDAMLEEARLNSEGDLGDADPAEGIDILDELPTLEDPESEEPATEEPANEESASEETP